MSNLIFEQLGATDSIVNKAQTLRLQYFNTCNFFKVICEKLCPQLFTQQRKLGTNVTIPLVLNC